MQLPAIATKVWPHFATAPDLFQGVTPQDLRKIAGLRTDKWFSRGARIFQEGESANSLYIMKKGMVKLVSLSDKGRETILHIFKPDEIFGELLLAEEKRPFTAFAIEESLVATISQECFVELLSSIPTLALNFIRLLSVRLATVERGVTEFSHTWSHDRLARVLLQLSQKYGMELPAGSLINVRLTHEDLANLIGTSRETVTMQLSKFTRMGLLKREGRRFIVSRLKLADYIRCGELRLENLPFLKERSSR